MAGIQMSIGDVDKHYISALDPSLDVRDIDRNIYDIWREDAFTDILMVGDRKQPTTQPFFSSWVNSELFYRGKVTSVSNSGTANVTVVLDADAQGIAALGTIVYLKDNTSGIVTSVSTGGGIDTIIVTTDSGTLTIAANDMLSFGGTVVGEKSIAPDNARFDIEKYSNKIEIFSQTSEITDIQAVGKLEAHIDGQDSFIPKDHLDKLTKLKGAMNMEYILGRISTTSFSDGTPTLVDPKSNSNGGGKGVQRMRGLNEYVEAYGTELEATGSGSSSAPVPNGTVVLADMENIVSALLSARAPRRQLAVQGTIPKIAFDKLFKNMGSSGVESVRMNVAGRDLDLNVDRVSFGNFEFNFTNMGLMDHPNVSNTGVGKSVYFMPYDLKVATYSNGSGMGSTNQKPAIGMRYQRSLSRYGNEVIAETYTGAFAPNPNGEVQEWKTIWTAKTALEIKAPTFLVSMKVTA